MSWHLRAGGLSWTYVRRPSNKAIRNVVRWAIDWRALQAAAEWDRIHPAPVKRSRRRH